MFLKNDKNFKQVTISNINTLYFVSTDGVVLSKYKNKIRYLKVFTTDTGYKYVKLWINNKTHAEFIHRLVAKAFIPNPLNKPEVNHKDGNKSNNDDTNLEWVTSKENKEHAVKNALLHPRKCEECARANFTNDQIRLTCSLIERGEMTLQEISMTTGVSYDTIISIRRLRAWRDISKNYDISKKPVPTSKYTREQIVRVCELLETRTPFRIIEKETGVKFNTISNIKNKHRWTAVSKDYKI